MSDTLIFETVAALDVLVLETIEPVAPPPSLRARILGAVAGTPQNSVTVRADEDRWRPFPEPGVRWKKLSKDAERGTLTLLLEIQPGATIAAHGHHGAEDCFVVAGSCRIGAVGLRAGDFHRVEAGERHGTVVTDDGCTLLLVLDRRDWAA
jgi:anti-sigma factor ChrR (cupin superfamily)